VSGFAPLTLTGDHVKLRPLDHGDLAGLQAAVSDGQLWRLWYTSIPAPDRMDAEIARRLSLQQAGSMMPLTVIETRTGRIRGMTSFMHIDRATPRVEIGSTWYAASAQRSALNTEAKLLLLTHAFDVEGCMAVEFRTHAMNHRSRQAIERLGARLDGILRQHMRMPNGTMRDSCVYSITLAEWPSVRAGLRFRLADHAAGSSAAP